MGNKQRLREILSDLEGRPSAGKVIAAMAPLRPPGRAVRRLPRLNSDLRAGRAHEPMEQVSEAIGFATEAMAFAFDTLGAATVTVVNLLDALAEAYPEESKPATMERLKEITAISLRSPRTFDRAIAAALETPGAERG